MTKTINALCIRTAMCGGGTAYDVYWRVSDKPSRPLHGGYTYATVIGHRKHEYYRTVDAIDPKSHWAMEQGMDKWDAFKKLERIAERLNARIAKRVFPELIGHKRLPSLWASWNKPSAEVNVPVRIQLPE